MANPHSSTINRQAEGGGAAQHTVELSVATAPVSAPLLASTVNPPVESGAPAPPTDSDAELSPAEKALQALRDVDDAAKTIDLHDTWAKTLKRIRWVMENLGSVAAVRT